MKRLKRFFYSYHFQTLVAKVVSIIRENSESLEFDFFMSIYIVGDIQGCFKELQQGLQERHFNPRADHIWTVGDLVNRGPQSLEVLQFFYDHQDRARIVLGNHDIHLIARFYEQIPPHKSDTLDAILHPRYEYLMEWLRQQPLLYHDASLSCVIVHAGIAPFWNLNQAKACAAELEQMLRGKECITSLKQVYGNLPDVWHDDLIGYDRLRFITNVFTRMRYCGAGNRLDLKCKLHPSHAPAELTPWFNTPDRIAIPEKIIFGHWASLNGETHSNNVIGLDTGCIWGGKLTFLKLQ
jgi:bis(5'-nucleosyl)-tetraphosphatase (symmetrical)